MPPNHDGDITPYPHIVVDDHRLASCKTLQAHGNVRAVKSMVMAMYVAVRPHHHIAADNRTIGDDAVDAQPGVVPDAQPCATPEPSPLLDVHVLAAILEDMAAGPVWQFGTYPPQSRIADWKVTEQPIVEGKEECLLDMSVLIHSTSIICEIFSVL